MSLASISTLFRIRSFFPQKGKHHAVVFSAQKLREIGLDSEILEYSNEKKIVTMFSDTSELCARMWSMQNLCSWTNPSTCMQTLYIFNADLIVKEPDTSTTCSVLSASFASSHSESCPKQGQTAQSSKLLLLPSHFLFIPLEHIAAFVTWREVLVSVFSAGGKSFSGSGQKNSFSWTWEKEAKIEKIWQCIDPVQKGKCEKGICSLIKCSRAEWSQEVVCKETNSDIFWGWKKQSTERRKAPGYFWHDGRTSHTEFTPAGVQHHQRQTHPQRPLSSADISRATTKRGTQQCQLFTFQCFFLLLQNIFVKAVNWNVKRREYELKKAVGFWGTQFKLGMKGVLKEQFQSVAVRAQWSLLQDSMTLTLSYLKVKQTGIFRTRCFWGIIFNRGYQGWVCGKKSGTMSVRQLTSESSLQMPLGRKPCRQQPKLATGNIGWPYHRSFGIFFCKICEIAKAKTEK